MTIKKIAFTGLLLSSVFLVACQPKETDIDTNTMMEETAPAEDESIMMKGTDQSIPGEDEMMLKDESTMEETTSPTASPMMESDTEMDAETSL